MEETKMTAIETSRLIEWLISKGHTYEEAANCINYIAAYENKKSGKEKELPSR